MHQKDLAGKTLENINEVFSKYSNCFTAPHKAENTTMLKSCKKSSPNSHTLMNCGSFF